MSEDGAKYMDIRYMQMLMLNVRKYLTAMHTYYPGHCGSALQNRTNSRM